MVVLVLGFATTLLLLPDMIIGSIILFALPAAQIPAGWQVADGTNGTLDLRAKFARGANVDGDIGAGGGGDNQTHDFTSATHRHQLDTLPAFSIAAGAFRKDQTDFVAVTGTTDSSDNRPAFNTAYYIQKIS